jgi:hypothetical protein
VTLLPVETTALRIVLERARPAASGVTEIAVWGEGGS